MQPLTTRFVHLRPVAAIVLAVALGGASAARAAVTSYIASLSGLNEAPTNSSLGVGSANVDIDPVANTMHVKLVFSGLTGTTTACHIHAPTSSALTGTAGVATTTPYFVGFPIGVTSGTFENTLDMTLTTSYNSSFITASGGTTAAAEAALFADIAAGKAYLNVHSTFVPAGEIRGFLVPATATPTTRTTWGRVRALYR